MTVIKKTLQENYIFFIKELARIDADVHAPFVFGPGQCSGSNDGDLAIGLVNVEEVQRSLGANLREGVRRSAHGPKILGGQFAINMPGRGEIVTG